MKVINAESGLSLLVSLSLFALISLSAIQWQKQQIHQTLRLYQQQQALLIADNQIDRQLAQQQCERTVEQNGIRFDIETCSPDNIRVRYPLGQIELKKGK